MHSHSDFSPSVRATAVRPKRARQAVYPGTNILTPSAGAMGNINASYLLTITALAPHTDTTCGAFLTEDQRNSRTSKAQKAIKEYCN